MTTLQEAFLFEQRRREEEERQREADELLSKTTLPTKIRTRVSLDSPPPSPEASLDQILREIESPTTKLSPTLDAEIDSLQQEVSKLEPGPIPTEEQRKISKNAIAQLDRSTLLGGKYDIELNESVSTAMEAVLDSVVGAAETTTATVSGLGSTIAGGLAGFTAGAGVGLLKPLEAFEATGVPMGPHDMELRSEPLVPPKKKGAGLLFTDITPAEAHMNVFDWITGRFTYAPRTEKGQAYTEATLGNIEKGLEFLRTGSGDFGFQLFGESPVAGAVFAALPDAALMLFGGLATKAAPKVVRKVGSPIKERVKLSKFEREQLKRHKEAEAKGQETPFVRLAEEEPVLTDGVKRPAGLETKAANMKLDALRDLPGARPQWRNAKEGEAVIQDILSGKKRPEIIVEVENGLPVRVIEGSETIQALGHAADKGAKFTSVKVRTFEKNVEGLGQRQLRRIQAESAAQKRAFFEQQEAWKELKKKARLDFKDTTVAGILDAAGNVKRELQKYGDAGVLAVREMELTAGASPRAHLRFQSARQEIYDGLSFRRNIDFGKTDKNGRRILQSEAELFDEFLFNKRVIAIAASKGPKKIKKFKFGAGTTPRTSRSWLTEFRRFDSDTYAKFESRAERFFDQFAIQLKRLRDEGLISRSDYNRMKDIPYFPRELLKKIDPVDPFATSLAGKGIDVGESGIHHFKQGFARGVRLDTENLLAEYLVRTENRIANNRANQALWDLANDQPTNGVVRKAKSLDPTKAPDGTKLIRVRVKGETKGMWMAEPLAREWVRGSKEITGNFANAMRIISGSAFVKPLATGYNPAFAFRNIFRDIALSYLVNTGKFSNFLPVGLAQMGKALRATAADAWGKKGRYVDYVREGGGMNFLTHQGQPHLSRTFGKPFLAELPPAYRTKLGKLGKALAKINEFSEIWVRLAIRENHIRQQAKTRIPDRTEATWAARKYLDFSQGGSWIKAADNGIPYLNPAVQATRSFARAARKDTKGLALRASQLMAIDALHQAFNWLNNPEMMHQQSDHALGASYIIDLGMKYEDRRGQIRHLYIPIMKDQNLAALSTLPSVGMQMLLSGRDLTRSRFKALAEGLPTLTGVFPTLQGILSYASNYDFWFGNPIWRGKEGLPPEMEVVEGPNGTHPAFRLIGEVMDLSPARLEGSLSRVFPPTNTYMHLVAGQGLRVLLNNTVMDPKERQEIESEAVKGLLANQPWLLNIVRQTHPAATDVERTERAMEKPAGKRERLRRELDRLLEGAEDPISNEEIRQIQQTLQDIAGDFSDPNEPFLAENLAQELESRHLLKSELRAAASKVPDVSGISWQIMLSADPAQRAAAFYQHWRLHESDGRQAMETIAQRLPGFWTEEFEWQFSRIKKEEGTAKPVGIVENWAREKWADWFENRYKE